MEAYHCKLPSLLLQRRDTASPRTMPTDQQPRSEPAASAQPPGRRTLPVHKCDICGRQFTRAFNLRSHLLSHGTQRPFPCSICGRSFVRHNDCKEHEKRHGGDKPFICKESSQDGTSRGCGRCFARKTHLLRHQRSKAFKACTGPVEGVVEEQVHENGDDEPAVQATEHVLPDSRSQTFSPVRRPASLKDILDWWERPVDARTTGMVDSCTWDQLLSTLSTELAQLDIFLQEQGRSSSQNSRMMYALLTTEL